MSRPLRIQYANTWYHVMNRGRRGETVFGEPADYTYFIKLLKDTAEMWHVRIAAYCLMTNHYHLHVAKVLIIRMNQQFFYNIGILLNKVPM